MRPKYVPDSGDLVWLPFDPQAGREQRGRRPAVVLSPRVYNERSQLAVACPITSKAKGYMFEVPLPAGGTVAGVILADHVKSIDWRERRVTPAGRIDQTTLDEVRARIRPLLGL